MMIPFAPVPKGRPKFTRTGHAYTPKKTAEYEKKVSEYYKYKCNWEPEMFEGPIKVIMSFQMPIPESFTKKRKQAIMDGDNRHTSIPDLDNLAKAVLDALNGIAFKDDSQISSMRLAKYYSSYPGVRLKIIEDVE